MDSIRLHGEAHAHRSYYQCTKIFGVKRHTDNARRKENKTQESSANGQVLMVIQHKNDE